MRRLGAWRIDDEGPRRLQSVDVALERQLEDWIENEPSLLREGLQIVGRQITLEAGRLDLLAVDPQGRWVVIELKAGRLYRETIAQALDYAAALEALSDEMLRQL